MLRRCTQCGAEKPPEQFFLRRDKSARNSEKRRTECIGCHVEKNRRWREKNREKDRLNGRNAYLRRQFGIGIEEEARMLAECGNRCEICGESPSGVGKSTRRLHVDHDAGSGQIRGMLCSKCNQGIGMFNHKPERLHAAAAYLIRAG